MNKLVRKKDRMRSNKLTVFPVIIMVILLLYTTILFGLLAFALFVSTRSPERMDFSGTYLMMTNKKFYFNLFEIFKLVHISKSSGGESTLLNVVLNSLIYSCVRLSSKPSSLALRLMPARGLNSKRAKSSIRPSWSR